MLPGLLGRILAQGAAMIRTIVVRAPVAVLHTEGDPAAPRIHELTVSGRIRLRSPTALLRWSRRPAAPALLERGAAGEGPELRRCA